MTEILKRYIDASNAFRKAGGSHEGAIALYDLLYDLQAKNQRTKEEERILADTYTLLEYLESECEYVLSTKKVVIFNKEVAGEDFSFFINKETSLESCLHSINEYLEWLSDAKTTLINYYNEHCAEYTPQADDNWYNTLEVYSGSIWVGGKEVSAHISAGDIFTSDHLLEIDFDDKEITDIGWEG